MIKVNTENETVEQIQKSAFNKNECPVYGHKLKKNLEEYRMMANVLSCVLCCGYSCRLCCVLWLFMRAVLCVLAGDTDVELDGSHDDGA